MGGMEFNKIFAAILVAGIIAMFAGFIAEKLVHPHKLEKDAYPVVALEGSAGGGAQVEAVAEPILAMIATADVARGQKLSKACAACHSFDNGGANGVGPNLWNIVGAKKQAHAGYAYSGVLNANGVENWTYDALNKFLWKPKKYAKGTKMGYAGMKKPADRAAMIAWLRTKAPAPKALPTEAEIAAEAPVEEATEDKMDEAGDAADADKTAEEGMTAEKADAAKAKVESDADAMKSAVEEGKSKIKEESTALKEKTE